MIEKFNEDQFLVEFFPDNAITEINSNYLQEILRERNNLKSVSRDLHKKLDKCRNDVQRARTELLVNKLKEPKIPARNLNILERRYDGN